MSNLILYGLEPSPPVRAVKLTLHALGLKYEYKLVNLLSGDHKTVEFMRMNPQHTVPLLDDNGGYIWDSHAISAYLVRKYAKDDALYPKDFVLRAKVDQRLHFECSVLFYGCLRSIALPVFYQNNGEVPRAKVDGVYDAFNLLETFLADGPYAAGKQLTIADFSLISTVASLTGIAPLHAQRHAKISAWMERLAQLPYYQEACGNGAKMLVDDFKERITKIV